jgi:hypothetical protein
MKKLLSVLLVFVLMCSCMTVLAESEAEWEFDMDNWAVKAYNGPGGDVVIPDTFENCTSDILGKTLFMNRTDITGVVVPENCNAIQRSVFSGCTAMTSVTLPETLQAIDQSVFLNCRGLTEIRVPAAVGWIGNDAFLGCENLTSITFAGEAPAMGTDVFIGIPESCVYYVPDDRVEQYQAVLPQGANVQPSGAAVNSFSYVRPESEFEINAETGEIVVYKGFAPIVEIPAQINGIDVTGIEYDAFRGHRYAYRVIMPEGVKHIGSNAFADMWSLSHVDIPDTLEVLEEGAFMGTYLAGIDLPVNLREIGPHAFERSSVGWVNFPEGLRTIGDYAFDSTLFLERISLPAGMESIGAGAFRNSDLSYVYLDGVELPQIAENAFEGCTQLTDIDLDTDCTKQQMLDVQAQVDKQGLTCRVWRNQNPNTQLPTDDLMTFDGNGLVTGYTGEITHLRPYDSDNDVQTVGIADGAFQGNQVVTYFSVNYNDLVTTIGNAAFADSALETIDLFDSVTTIGAGAFENSALTAVEGGEAVTTVGERAFANTPIESIDLPAVTEIGASAFEGSALTSITGLENVASIGSRAFAGTALGSFVIPANIDVAIDAFDGVPTEGLCLSADATDAQVELWSEALNLPWYNPIAREGEASSFVAMPFVPTSEADFVIDESTGTITEYLGTDVDVVVPRTVGGVTVTGIGAAAFDSARDYTDTEMTTNRTEWVQIRSLVLPETVTSVSEYAFSYMQQLETFVCYGPLEKLPYWAFAYCRSLDNVVFVNGVRTIGGNAFESAGTLNNLYFGKHLDTIEQSAFWGSAITRCVADAKTLANNAFMNCPNLTELHFTDRVESAEMGAVTECPNLAVICIEGDPSFIPGDGLVFGASANLTVNTRADLTEEQKESVKYLVGWQEVAPNVTFTTDACTRETAMPDVTALISAPPETEPVAPVVPEQTDEPGETEPDATGAVHELTSAAQSESDFYGSWVLTTITDEDGLTYQAGLIGMEMALNFHEDGRVDMSFAEETETLDWTLEEGFAVITDGVDTVPCGLSEDGQLQMVMDETTLMCFERGEASAVKTEPEPAGEPGDASQTDASDRMEIKYVMITAEVSGATLTAEQMGNLEYSLIFHADGTAEVILAGTSIGVLPWTQVTVDGAVVYSIDYYGIPLNAVVTETGFDMNYMDSMLIHYEPEA